jgi:hypothetical protein
MGIFGLFGNKKNEAEAEQERQEALNAKKEEALEQVKEAHKELSWPVIGRINPVNIKDSEGAVMEETVAKERKEEVGQLIYEEDLPTDTLKFLSGQELLFLLTAMEQFNKKAPLPEFEKNHRKVYNEVLGRIRDAEHLFVLYDKNSGYPFIDHGFASVYFEEDICKKAAELFGKQFRNLVCTKCVLEDKENPNSRSGFFDFLYYQGIENLIIDNGAYRARFKRSEIVAAPGDWTNAGRPNSPINPPLNFAMLDFLEELKWPVNYEKRNDVLRAKEKKMVSLIRNSSFIVPVQHEGPAEMLSDGRIKLNKDSRIRFLVMKTQDDKQFLPVYTDGFEYAKLPKAKEWNAGVFRYQDILRFIQDKDGIRINPEGQGLVMTKERIMAAELEVQKAVAAKGAAKAPDLKVVPKPQPQNSGQSADAAVQQALNQAMAKMREDNK